MRARAPGKLVLSGAYAVLRGAPAIVTAVSRHAVADTERAPERDTPELRAALGARPPPWFDATELFGDTGKLGLGASAAILVAALAALELERDPALADRALADRVLPLALDAHARAQGGGSGIDVAASARGHTLLARRENGELVLEPIELPALHFEVWSSGAPASTPDLVARVRALEARDPSCLDDQMAAAEAAARAVLSRDAAGFLRALDDQARALARLGDAAGAPIVTSAARELADAARARRSIVLPSGAGGGDVVLYAGLEPPDAALVQARERFGHSRLDLTLGARGVHRVSPRSGVDDPLPKG